MISFNDLKKAFGVENIANVSMDFANANGKNNHEWARDNGFKETFNHYDGTITAKNGDVSIPLTSYGWGSFYEKFSNEKSTETFMKMFEEGIIGIWRITAFINGETHCYYECDTKHAYTIEDYNNGESHRYDECNIKNAHTTDNYNNEENTKTMNNFYSNGDMVLFGGNQKAIILEPHISSENGVEYSALIEIEENGERHWSQTNALLNHNEIIKNIGNLSSFYGI